MRPSGKPVGVVGAANSAIGTARAQQKLQNVLLSVLAYPFPHRGVLVGRAREKVEDGRLTDEATRDFPAAYLEGLADFARRFG